MHKLRIIIASDRIAYKSLFKTAVELTQLARVEHVASSSELALERLRQAAADVVLLDAADPGTHKVLEAIRDESMSTHVILLAGDSSGHASIPPALAGGVVIDIVRKPPESEAARVAERVAMHLQGVFLQIAAGRTGWERPPGAKQPEAEKAQPDRGGAGIEAEASAERPSPPTPVQTRPFGRADVVLVAASTGGPRALETMLRHLPEDLPAPVLVVQHMPSAFTRKMAESLDLKCRLPVAEAADGEPVLPGRIYIAPGGCNMTVQAVSEHERIIRVGQGPAHHGLRPSADALFISAAEAYRNKSVLAVILTGMGSDGSLGVSELKISCACRCIAQSKASCAVFGMPRSAAEAGLVDEEAPPTLLGTRIVQLTTGIGGPEKEG